MKMSFVTEKERGLSLIEVLVIVLILTCIVIVFWPRPISRARARAPRIQCVNNLKQIALAYRIWEGDHADKYPIAVPEMNGGALEFTNGLNAFRVFQVMSNQLGTPWILFCPADSERIKATTFNLRPPPSEIPFTSNSNLSYFVGLDVCEADPQCILTGDRNITNGAPLKNGVLELTQDHPAGWTAEMHNNVGNVALADGSVQEEGPMGLRAYVTNAPAFTNRLLMPVLGP